MDNPIPESVKKTWDNWNIRGVILFSLLLQTVLILLAPLRKGMGYKLIILLIWSAYFLADSAATFAIGLIAERAINSQTPTKSNELLVLWAPFLLLHLGGPDTITAVALEDNELWLRQLFGLIFQAGFTFYVFLLSLPGNKLFVPTILVFIAGIIKCFERTRAMYLASWEKFRESTIIELAKDVKFICFGSLVAALSVFYFQVEKHGLNDFDLGVTYTLFLGGIALDVISFFMGNFSEWTFAALRNHHKSCIARIIRWFLNLKSSRWQQSRIGGKHGVFVFATPFLPRRWSGSVSGLSVIKAHQSKRYGIDKIFQYIAITTYRIIKFLQIDKIIACFGLADFANEIRIKTSLSQEPLTKELWVFIFNEIKRKSKNGDEIRRKTESGQDPEINDPEVGTIKIPNFEYDLEADIRKGLRKLFSAKGDCTLKEMDTNCDLIQFVEKVNFSFGKSIIFWHIATEFLYEKTAKEAISDEETYNAREFSKILSDYMFYLLVLKPTMMNSKENVGLETLRDEAKFRFQGKISPATRAKLNSSVNSLPVDQAERMVDKLQSLDYLKDKNGR
ncbi:DUF4220 domain-containing protein [Citrus sinensis]|nr:DUF4220 domain-containing protein [Citrus sinensis]